MARTVKEWIGKTDDSKAPPRVRQRIFDRETGICHWCRQPISKGGFECDHIIALINGGENRESNLGPVHPHCHKLKSAQDVKEKAKVQRTRQKHTGAKKPAGKIQSKGFDKKERKEKLDFTTRRQLYG